MAASKPKPAPKPIETTKLIPVWVHKKGVPGYDVVGNPVKAMDPNQYGFVTAMVDGVQPADTDPMNLKEYTPKKTYNTRQMTAAKNETDSKN